MFKIKGNKDVTDLILTSNIEHISHLFTVFPVLTWNR